METPLEIYLQDTSSDFGGNANEIDDGMRIEVLSCSETRGSGGSNHYSEGPEPAGSELDRSCWICFATDEDNRLASWVQPCRCRGTTKWVHQSCLYRWIDEKQNGNHRSAVLCQQCRTEYIIEFPKMGKIATALECLDYTTRTVCPYLAAGIFIGCVYWTALTYGAITVAQVMGQTHGIDIIEDGYPFIVFIGLPAIPAALICSRFVRWENVVLRLMRSKYNVLRKLPLLHWSGEPELEDTEDNSAEMPPVEVNPLEDPLNVYRLFCGAMLLPTIATVMGGLFFKRHENRLHRALLGGVTYIAVKGLLKIYLRQKLYIRGRRRRIVDYTEENVRTYLGVEAREAAAAGDQDPNGDPGNVRLNAGIDEYDGSSENGLDYEPNNGGISIPSDSDEVADLIFGSDTRSERGASPMVQRSTDFFSVTMPHEDESSAVD